jgi:hypothetical protein
LIGTAAGAGLLGGLLFDQSRQARTEPFSRAVQPVNRVGERWLPMAAEYT